MKREYKEADCSPEGDKKSETLKGKLRLWVREQEKEFSLGDAKDQYIKLGGKMIKKDGYDVYGMISDLVEKTKPKYGPQGGFYAFCINVMYVGEKKEQENIEKRRQAIAYIPPPTLWDKLAKETK